MKNSYSKRVGAAVAAVALTTFVALPCRAATSTPAGFTDNLEEALASAKGNGKYVFACFSGSDWCGWCMRFEREVLSKQKFLDGATNDFELVYIDMPEDKSLLSERAAVENEKLVTKYRVSGFPTVLVLDANGDVLTKTGYRKGGAKKYVEHLKDIRAKGPQLREIERLFELHIAPFENELRRIVFVGMIEKVGREIEKLPEDEQEAKAKEMMAGLLPGVTVAVDAAISAFKAKDVPELVAADKAEALKEAEKLLKQLREELQAK